ncbi:MAG: winged helix-turn-helix transcriptional regulator [Candidatus Aenigmatarchaeota archaeon]
MKRLILLLLFLPSVYGMEMAAEMRIDSGVYGTMKFSNVTSPFNLTLPADAEIEIDGMPSQNPALIERECQLVFFARSPVEQNDKNFFLLDLKIPHGAQFDISLSLPRGAWLEKAFPVTHSLKTDGERIKISWSGIASNESITLFVVYQKETFSWIWLIPIVLAMIFVGLFTTRRKKPKEIVHLLPDEKIVYEMIKAAHEIRQRDIQRQVDFSKAKLSRIIRRLQEMGVIEVIPRGNTNIIRLKK